MRKRFLNESKKGEYRKYSPLKLLTKTQTGNDLSVLFDIDRFKIIEHTLSATYHFEQSATRMFVVFVDFKVFVKMIDSLG